MPTPEESEWIAQLLKQSDWVRKFAGDLVNEDVAQEVSQETWVASLTGPPANRSTPRPWLRTVVANLVSSRSRSERRRRVRETLVQQAEPLPESSPEDLVARMELLRFLLESILALGRLQRQAVVMRYLDGLSAVEIARSLGVPEGTVRRRVKEGLDGLRRALDQRGGRAAWLRTLVLLAPDRDGAEQQKRPDSRGAPTPIAARAWTVGGLLTLGLLGALLLAILGAGWRWLPWPGGGAPTPPPTTAGVRPQAPRFMGAQPVGAPAAPAAEVGRLVGSVRAADGRLLDGVVVTLGWTRAQNDAIATKTTAEGGRFEFTGLAPLRYALTASGQSGWAARSPVPVAATGPTRADLVLVTAGAAVLEGRVFDGGGGGLPRAEVTLASASRGWVRERLFKAVADDAGRYRMVVPLDRYELRAQGAGYGRVHSWLDISGPRRYDVWLLAAAAITGRVIEHATELPVAGAEVVIVEDRMSPKPTTTDASGKFHLTAHPGNYRVYARKGGLSGSSDRFAARPDETARQEITLAAVPPIIGRVLTAEGKGAAGVEVTAETTPIAPALQGFSASIKSAPDGSFSFDGMPTGPVDVLAEAPGALPQVVRLPEVTTASPRTAQLRLVRGAVVRGRVMGPDGVPVAGARIVVRSVPVTAPGEAGTSGTSRNAESVSSGKFEIGGLPTGEVWLSAGAEGAAVALPAAIPVAAGEVREVDLVLAAGARISGTVSYPDGKPAPGVRMEALTADQIAQATASTDHEGRFTLGPLAAGPIVVRLGSGWHYNEADPQRSSQVKQLSVAPGEHRKGLAFETPRGGGPIVGTVVDGEGRPVAGATVDLHRLDAHGKNVDFEARVFSDDRGRFQFPDAPPGAHRFTAEHPGLLRARQTYISPGAPAVVRMSAP